MTTVHFHLPPEIEAAAGVHEAGRLCLLCVMKAKGHQVIASTSTWEPLISDNKHGEQKWITYPRSGPAINEAVIVGITDALPGVMMPLCWDCIGAISPPGMKQPGAGLAVANAPLPPGLNGTGHTR